MTYLSDDEVARVVKMVCVGQDGEATDQQIIDAITWANEQKIASRLLKMVLDGEIYLDMRSLDDGPLLGLVHKLNESQPGAK